MLPLIEGSFRSTLYGAAGREAIRTSPKSVAKSEEDVLSMRVESGDKSVVASAIPSTLYIAAG